MLRIKEYFVRTTNKKLMVHVHQLLQEKGTFETALVSKLFFGKRKKTGVSIRMFAISLLEAESLFQLANRNGWTRGTHFFWGWEGEEIVKMFKPMKKMNGVRTEEKKLKQIQKRRENGF